MGTKPTLSNSIFPSRTAPIQAQIRPNPSVGLRPVTPEVAGSSPVAPVHISLDSRRSYGETAGRRAGSPGGRVIGVLPDRRAPISYSRDRHRAAFAPQGRKVFIRRPRLRQGPQGSQPVGRCPSLFPQLLPILRGWSLLSPVQIGRFCGQRLSRSMFPFLALQSEKNAKDSLTFELTGASIGPFAQGGRYRQET